MSFLLRLAALSAWNRRLTLGLLMASIALSTVLLVGIERLRQDARASFNEAVSGADLVVGPRGSPVGLILFSVFRIGAPTDTLSWAAFQKLERDPAVAWAVPLSLGDSHRGFAVLGTTTAYFERFRHGEKRPLTFAAGRGFSGIFEAVIGAEVAERLKYTVGARITLAHGTGEFALAEHTDKPFTVTGILTRTGTPVDRTVHVSLEAIEAIHLDWRGGTPIPGVVIPPEFVRKFDLTPKTISAALVGLNSRAEVFEAQRRLHAERAEPMLAVLPGVALDELWQLLGTAERTLSVVSALVALVSFAGLIAAVLAGLNERRRELAILRAVGARPRELTLLLFCEGILVTVGGVAAGLTILALGTAAFGDTLLSAYGVQLATRLLTMDEAPLVAGVLAAGCLASLVPGIRAYRLSLADGLTPHT
ncbi:MAG: ABC transporter permease [Burkholderiales bacterium]|nr:ABC transporter permease [Burkholderiales bacterium]